MAVDIKKRNAAQTPRRLARGLGWFSIALGLGELAAPRAMARLSGTRVSPTTMRLYGARELACGLGVLLARDPSPFLWARIAGDGLDLGTLACGPHRAGQKARRRTAWSLLQVLGLTALDVYASSANTLSARALTQRREEAGREYRQRSGFPQTASAMQGKALGTFKMPRDMATPDALRAYGRPPREAA